MLNIIVPLSVPSMFFDGADFPYPKPLIEIAGKPMIQYLIDNLATIAEDKRFIFILRDEDCSRYHLDSTVRLLAGNDSIIIRLSQPTQGAACSALLAIDHIGPDQPLLIVNGDQLFDVDLNTYLAQFRARGSDAGVLSFDSVHPRWSYARLENGDDIIECAEKHPVSRHAIAGFYYFARGADFILATQHAIRKNTSVDGVFYVAPVLNELILLNRKLTALPVPNSAYHTFYSPKKIEEYEAALHRLPN
jgi:dTDP-glucose pyrophosphorylase